MRRRRRRQSNAAGIVVGAIVTAGLLLALVVIFALQYTPKARPSVTIAEYDAIRVGMTYDEVCDTVGMYGERVYEYRVEIEGASVTMSAYKWVNPDGTKVACAFDDDGRVEMKAWVDRDTGIEQKWDELFE